VDRAHCDAKNAEVSAPSIFQPEPSVNGRIYRFLARAVIVKGMERLTVLTVRAQGPETAKGESSVATLTKAQIVENLFAKNLFTKGEASHIIETLFELMKQSLEEGEDVLISGFGKFCVKEKGRRRGRNPQTGESMILESRRVVTFKHSGVLREKISEEEQPPVKAKMR
jgi:integration host factor subunit alpha